MPNAEPRPLLLPIDVAWMGVGLALWGLTIAVHGLSSSPDTLTYLAMADALADGSLDTGIHFRPYVAPNPPTTGWPPGYPALLALLRPWLSIQATLTVVAGGSMAIIAVATSAFLRSTTHSTLSTIAVLGSPPLLHVLGFGWSEGPWVALFMLHTWLLSRGSAPLLLGVVGGATFLFRHAALPLVLLQPLYLALTRGRRDALEAAVGSALVAGPWVATSLYLSGRIGYAQPPTDIGLIELFVAYIRVLMDNPPLLLAVGVAALVAKGRWPPIVGWLLANGTASAALYLYIRSQHHLDDPDLRMVLPASLAFLLAAVVVIGRRERLAWLSAVFGLSALVTAGPRLLTPEARRPMSWIHEGSLVAYADWVALHTEPDDLIVGPMGFVVRHRTGRAVVAPVRPPYGLPLTVAELQRMVDTWDGRVLLFHSAYGGVRPFGEFAHVLDGSSPLDAAPTDAPEGWKGYVLTRR